MSALLSITQPLPLAIAPGAGSAADGATNLLTPDPREIARADGSAPLFAFDLGAPTAVDTFFLGYTNAIAGTAFTVSGDGSAVLGVGVVAHSHRRAPRRHCFLQLAQPAVTRYVYLTARAGERFTAGVAVVGRALRPGRGHEKGSGRPIFDTSVIQRQFSGGFGIQRGATAGGWNVTIVPTDDERERLYAMALDLGLGGSLLVAEHSDGGPAFNEALHWGLLAKLEPWSRDDPDESRWALSIQDWA